MFQKMIDDLIGRPDGPEEREEAASRLIETCGYAAAAITLLPIPGSEILGVMPVHVGMVVGLSQIYGLDMSRERATDLVLRIGATVGASLITTRIATTFAKIALPGLGGLFGAPIIFATTLSIGAVARTWMAHEGNISPEEMKDIYKKTVKEARSNFDPTKMRSDEMKDLARKAAAEAAEPAAEPTPAPAPAPAPESEQLIRLRKAKAMFDAGLISEEDFDRTRQRILDDL